MKKGGKFFVWGNVFEKIGYENFFDNNKIFEIRVMYWYN